MRRTSSSGHKKILIVEDETDYAAGLGIMFMAYGFQVSMAYNGEEAVDKARREIPDLILMDITMPRMNGFEACKIIRNTGATRHIPIVALSASSKADAKKEAFENGVDDYISKPFAHQHLIDTVLKFTSEGRGKIVPPANILGDGSSAAVPKELP